jgi:hypothetical protein
MFTADTIITGVKALAYREPQTIGTPPTITVNEAATFIQDLGVRNANTGLPMVNVPSQPTIGEYAFSLSTGVYTCAVADEAAAILISYRYTESTGNTLQMYNHPMGFGPVIGFLLQEQYQNNSNGLWLPNVRVGKMDGATKLDDYFMQTSDFEAFALPSGLVGEQYAAL